MISKKLAKAILLSPNEGTIIDLDEIYWKSRVTPLGVKLDIWVNDEQAMVCDLDTIRSYVEG